MILDSEQQKAQLLDCIANTKIEGTYAEICAIAEPMNNLVQAVKNAAMVVEEDKEQK
jgi:hypothetical protein